jgi:hypothetical protein
MQPRRSACFLSTAAIWFLAGLAAVTRVVVAEIKSIFFSIVHALAYAKRIAVFGSFARGEETPEIISISWSS